MTPYICTTCGTQFAPREGPPNLSMSVTQSASIRSPRFACRHRHTPLTLRQSSLDVFVTLSTCSMERRISHSW